MTSAILKIQATYRIPDVEDTIELPREVIKFQGDIKPLDISPAAFSEFAYSIAFNRAKSIGRDTMVINESWTGIKDDLGGLMDTVEEIAHHRNILIFGAVLYSEGRYFSATLVKNRIGYQEFDFLPEWII